MIQANGTAPMANMKVEANAIVSVNQTLRLMAGSVAVLLISLMEESRNIPARGAMMKRRISEASMAKIQLKRV
jgi:hypothetical protein